MPVTNFIVDSLPDYVKENRELLLNSVAVAGPTIDRMAKMLDVKKSAPIHLLEIDPEFQNGAGCGYTRGGTAELTDRVLEAGLIKIDLPICQENLRGKWAEFKLRSNAETDPELAFQAEITAEIANAIANKLEKAIWQGDTDSLDADLANFDGLLKIAGSEADVTDVPISAGASMRQAVAQVLAAIPAKARKKGARIFMAPELFEAYLQELVNANLYHYSGPQDEDPIEWTIPGTRVRVVSTEGLAETLYLFASWERNLVYGTDREGDKNDIRVVYDVKDEIFDVLVKFVAGVQIAFPADVVLGEMAAAPVSPEAASATLADLAASVETIATNSANLADMKTDLGTIATKSAGLDNLAGIKTDTGALADADHVFKTKEQA